MVKKSIEFAGNNEYTSWICDVKDRFRKSQIKAAVKVNTELLNFYWDLGKDIVERQKGSEWGDGFLKAASKDLMEAFPETRGFSLQNLKSIRYWYEFYNNAKNVQIGLQAVSQFEHNVKELLTSIPWGHNQRIMYKCNDVEEALFYVHSTIEHGWSRAVLEHQIDSGLFHRKGKAITNFKKTLPGPQSDLAEQTLKDPYNFEFLTVSEKYNERELEDAMVTEITKLLLELGTGFTYAGRQYHVRVGEQDFYIDLLFYNVKLRCYVVIELKTSKYQPEFAGKLSFYMTAVNRQIKEAEDNPTIGLLICKDKDGVVAEYSIDGISQPIGITEYEISEALSKELKDKLPSIEELEAEVGKLGEY